MPLLYLGRIHGYKPFQLLTSDLILWVITSERLSGCAFHAANRQRIITIIQPGCKRSTTPLNRRLNSIKTHIQEKGGIVMTSWHEHMGEAQKKGGTMGNILSHI